MNHDEYREKLSALLDGELDDAEQAEVTAHLASCPACQTYLIELTTVHDALSRMDTPSAPNGFAEGVLARLHENEPNKSIDSVDNEENERNLTVRRRNRRLIASLAAAAAVLAIVSVPRMFRMGGAEPPMASSARSAAVYGASDGMTSMSGGTEDAAESVMEEAAEAAEAETAPMTAMEAPTEIVEYDTVEDALDGGALRENKTMTTAALPEAAELEEANEELPVMTLGGDGASDWLAKHGMPLGDGKWLVSVEDVNALPDTLELVAADDVQRPTDGMLVITLAETEAAP